MTVKEASKYARCGVRLVYRAAKSKKLKSARVSSRLLFLTTWLDLWISEGGHQP